MAKVEIYGADWCGDTQNSLKTLKRLGVDYVYTDVEKDEAASKWVKEQNNGRESKPTLKIGARVLSVPSDEELEAVLVEEDLVSKRK